MDNVERLNDGTTQEPGSTTSRSSGSAPPVSRGAERAPGVGGGKSAAAAVRTTGAAAKLPTSKATGAAARVQGRGRCGPTSTARVAHPDDAMALRAVVAALESKISSQAGRLHGACMHMHVHACAYACAFLRLAILVSMPYQLPAI